MSWEGYGRKQSWTDVLYRNLGGDGWPVLVKILTRGPLGTLPDFDITSANGSISG
jgi:hypothetical protein